MQMLRNERCMMYSMYEKWWCDFDRECKTVTWLGCETRTSGGKQVVVRLNCSVCMKYKKKTMGRRNYSKRWIIGADSLCTGNICDHTHSNQHAMSLLLQGKATAQGESSSSYAPIAVALNHLLDLERDVLRKNLISCSL